MGIREYVKKTIAQFIFGESLKGKIVIASSGRAGSTMLFEAVSRSYVVNEYRLTVGSKPAIWLAKLCSSFVSRIDEMQALPFRVCKTHDVCRDSLPAEYKYIFVYGDPLDSAASVEKITKLEGMHWFRLHQEHLCAEGDFEDLYVRDVLNYRGQLDSWLSKYRGNVLCIDYEDLWDECESLSAFLGFEVILPMKRQRSSKPEASMTSIKLFDDLRDQKSKLKENYLAVLRGV